MIRLENKTPGHPKSLTNKGPDIPAVPPYLTAHAYLSEINGIIFCAVRSFALNAGSTLHFHAEAPGPVLYDPAEALTKRPLSEAFPIYTNPVQRFS